VSPAGEPALEDRVRAAIAARDRLRRRPLRETIAALAAAAARWRADEALLAALPAAARLSAPVVAEGVAIAAAALDADAMTALVDREWGPGAAARPAPDGPALVAHVLASNVPALALPAIALAALAGAAMLIKSGRDDTLSAEAFVRALGGVDPELAATVVATYWPGGSAAADDAVVGADVVVLTGGDAMLGALAPRVRGRLIAHGARASVALVGRAALADADAVADALAVDVALHDQRGCLSPQAVYVETGGALGVEAFAERLHAALARVAARLQPGPATLQERAVARGEAARAEWSGASAVHAGAGGTVIVDPDPTFAPTAGLRSVRVHPLATAGALPACLPAAGIECVGAAAVDGAPLAAALRARGASRLCAVGRMQRPSLAWPRGQHPPLGALHGRLGPPEMQVET